MAASCTRCIQPARINWYFSAIKAAAFSYGLPLPTANLPAELLVENLNSLDWGNWLLRADGILYLQRTAEADLIKLQHWTGSQQLIASLPPRAIKPGRSITQLPDNSLILSMYQSKEADIVAIDLAAH